MHISAASPLTSQFTSKERDAETGLDYFGARYYSGAQGRFTSTDPLYFQAEMLADPQRFNLYAYTRNNPLSFIDLDGRFPAPLHRTMARNEMAAVQLNKTPLFQSFAATYAQEVDSLHPLDSRQWEMGSDQDKGLKYLKMGFIRGK
jgi:RHS repeat-associated protein